MGLGGGILGGIIGGFITGGPIGALIGAGVGLALTSDSKKETGKTKKKDHNPAMDLLKAWFRCYGKLAKADGVVAQEEADFIQGLLHELEIQPEYRKFLIQAFNEGKYDPGTFGELLHDLKKYVPQSSYESILEGFCLFVLADGKITSAEMKILRETEIEFGMNGYVDRFLRISQGKQQNTEAAPDQVDSLEEAYKLLDIPSSATESEVRSAWRKKIAQFHPDKIQGKGLPEEFIRFAEEQTRKINNAYELISKSRA